MAQDKSYEERVKGIMADVCATLTSLLDVEKEAGDFVYAPESSFYLAMNSDLDRWQAVRHILFKAGWIGGGAMPHTIILTPAGREKAIQLEAVLENRNGNPD